MVKLNILSVESSCDETAVAVVVDGRTVLTDCIASQVELITCNDAKLILELLREKGLHK